MLPLPTSETELELAQPASVAVVTPDAVTSRAPTDDVALLRQCAAGDDEAWSEFEERYGRFLDWLVRRAARRFARGALQAADVEDLRSALVTALLDNRGRVLARYDGRAAVTTYLSVVGMRFLSRAVGKLMREVGARSLSGQASDATAVIADERAQSPELAAIRADDVRAVRDTLAALATRDALLLRLGYQENLAYETIASVLGVAVNSVGPLLQRARKRFAKQHRRRGRDQP